MANYSAKPGFSNDEIAGMGNLLRKQYGTRASEIATELMVQHVKADDFERTEAWSNVLQYLTGPDHAGATLH